MNMYMLNVQGIVLECECKFCEMMALCIKPNSQQTTIPTDATENCLV